jgi:hypothetical protein
MHQSRFGRFARKVDREFAILRHAASMILRIRASAGRLTA